MHLHEITADSLTKVMQTEVPDIYVIIAKHKVMGMDSEAIKSIIGCELQDIQEVESTELYKAVRAQCAMAYAALTADQTTGWDAIENIAMTQLLKRLPFEKDSEFLLRAAAVANKAVRKHGKESGVLDPSLKRGTVAITLTQRLVSRLNGRGDKEVAEERVLSIHDGSMSNPSFDEVDSLLSVRTQPNLPRALEIKTRTVEPTMDDLLGDMLDG